MKISLTKRAEKSYHSIKSYIADEWGESVSGAFEQKAIDFLNLLEDFPELGSVEMPEKQIRGFQLTKQTRVFYRVKKEQIVILSFFDVRQNPEKKPK